MLDHALSVKKTALALSASPRELLRATPPTRVRRAGLRSDAGERDSLVQVCVTWSLSLGVHLASLARTKQSRKVGKLVWRIDCHHGQIGSVMSRR